MTEPLAYLNGRMIPASEARLPVYDAGLVQGAAVTEMMRTVRHRVYRLEDHLGRLDRSLRYAGFEIGMSLDDLAAAVRELAEHNTRLLDPEDDLGLVLFVTAGPYPTLAGSGGDVPLLDASSSSDSAHCLPSQAVTHGSGPPPTICAHTFPLPFDLWAEKMQRGAHLVTPSVRQIPPQCLPPHMKARSRMHYYLADQQARLADPQAMALLLDLDGHVTEASTANFLYVDDGTIVSPPAQKILPGISRQVVITLAEQLNIPFVERDVHVFDAINADEAFLASTPYCLMPVARINGRSIGNECPGEVYGRLMDAWNREVNLEVVQQIIQGARRRQNSG